MSVVTPADCCPACGYLFDRATNMSHKREHAIVYPDGERTEHYKEPPLPKPGDFTMCLSCGTLLRYDGSIRTYRPTLQDMRDLDAEQLEEISKAQNLIRSRGPLRRKVRAES